MSDGAHPPPSSIQASCVAIAGNAALIVGRSRAGKSSLALELLAMGAELVGDDLVALTRRGDRIIAAPVAPPPQLIEVRQIGLLRAGEGVSAPLRLIVDLDRSETARLPPLRTKGLLGVQLPLIFAKSRDRVAAVTAVMLRHGGMADPDALGVGRQDGDRSMGSADDRSGNDRK